MRMGRFVNSLISHAGIGFMRACATALLLVPAAAAAVVPASQLFATEYFMNKTVMWLKRYRSREDPLIISTL